MSLKTGGPTHQRSGLAKQRGGFAMGLVVGLLVGLALALGVALYIAKVPSPFHDKVPHRTPEQEAAEAEKLKSWDPNAGLGGKPVPPRPAPASSPAQGIPVPPAPAAVASQPAPGAAAAPAPAVPKSSRDAAAILAGEPVTAPKAPAPARPGADPFVYFVQVGAFSSADDAEQQRAKLALQGIMAKVSEREQGGRTIHRVRVGPFDSQAEAVAQQGKLKAGGVDAALVRQERN
ncbi:SPOR domain-containing protein [Ideonella sp.]|uniref:SPOR domain-containing protein n=1 Tax=Ideonella sp. TaxID=1929293 RepID=UPI002B48131F|nr:SPOR domain-containing protein [Ideonella sp.]HJV69422.1 SPOR domain-containing protein [Ideonella sp.]